MLTINLSVCVCVCSLVPQSPAAIMSKTEEQRAQLGESIMGTALTNWLYIHTVKTILLLSIFVLFSRINIETFLNQDNLTSKIIYDIMSCFCKNNIKHLCVFP